MIQLWKLTVVETFKIRFLLGNFVEILEKLEVHPDFFAVAIFQFQVAKNGQHFSQG